MTPGKISHNAPNPQRDEIIKLLRDGIGPAEIGRRLGVSRSTACALAYRNRLSVSRSPTLFDRMAKLHAEMDAVLAETAPMMERSRENFRVRNAAFEKAKAERRAAQT